VQINHQNGHARRVQFTQDVWPGLADGSVTVTFRRWKRAQAKAGGRHRVAGMELAIDAVTQVPVGDLTDADARAAGEADRAGLLERLARGAARRGEALADDELVWRIDFHLAGEDSRVTLREDADLSGSDRTDLARRLERLDKASKHGPWTRQVLRLIGDQPGVVSTDLAAELGRERFDFKLDVRKLKALGLTESLVKGYRLSPRGEAFLAGEAETA
jgi:hypothetical protein